MAIGDILSDIGSGIKTAGRVAGAVAEPLGKAVANEEAGYSPQIAAEQRQHAQKLEDEQINAKAAELENQMALGQKYGTLTPQQHQQYVDSIAQLYSNPRHAPVLMEKLRKAIHPNGATAQGPSAPLPNAGPEGGTAAADDQLKVAQENRKGAEAEALAETKAQIAAKYHRPAGKSPPVAGTQLPPDAIGADGQPLGPEARSAGNSFVEWNGSFWPVAKPKPVFKTVKGHSVLVDSQSGAILRDLGPTGTAKTTTRQTLQPGDDGQMHMVSLTSVTTPEGATIEVEPENEAQAPQGDASSTAQTPAKKVGSILPKTGAKPVQPQPGSGTASPGRVVPGLSNLALSKTPLGRSDAAQYTKIAEDANAKTESYNAAKEAMKNPSPSSDQELIYSWVRSNIAGAGRMTQAEFKAAAAVGSLPQKAQNWYNMTATGKLSPEIEKMLFTDIERNTKAAQATAEDLRKRLQPGSGQPSGSTWKAPADAPPAPKVDGKVLKANGQVVAKSQGGNWVAP